jgi:DNA-binding response OmpR family regulator
MIQAERDSIPIIFVTAKSDEFDRIYGIEIGGDDYLTKPFSPRELVVRAKRLLSRHSAIAQTKDTDGKNSVFLSGAVRLHLDTMEVFDNDVLVTLTLRDRIIEQVWGYDSLGQTRMVDDIVKRLRKKLSVEIETVWGVGYRYNA